MSKILGMDSAYTSAVEKRGMNMVISANLVSEMVHRIRELESNHSAAPDLLEALEEAHWAMCQDHITPDLRNCVEKAISKAKGEPLPSPPLNEEQG